MKKLFDFDKLQKHLFWDLNTKTLDPNKNTTIIIERVFNRGDIDDIKYILEYFGKETIKKEIVKAGFLDKKTLNWASLFFRIPKTNFRCYTKIQSTRIHWNF